PPRPGRPSGRLRRNRVRGGRGRRPRPDRAPGYAPQAAWDASFNAGCGWPGFRNTRYVRMVYPSTNGIPIAATVSRFSSVPSDDDAFHTVRLCSAPRVETTRFG